MSLWLKITLALAVLIAARFMSAIVEAAGIATAWVQFGFAGLYAATFVLLYDSCDESRPPLGTISFKRLCQAVAAGLAFFALGIPIYAGTSAIYSKMGWETPVTLSFLNVHGVWETAALVVFIAAAVPLEEFIFRGIILHRLRTRFTASRAILLSSICFSIYHLSGFQLATTFIWGLGLGLLFLRTNSLLVPIIAHLTMNALSVGLFLSGAIPKG